MLATACTTTRETAAPARTVQVPIGTIRDVMKQIVEESSQALFDKYADDLQNVAKEALGDVKSKNVQALFEVGAKLDVACENCHLEFWYPGEKKP